ncbi:hypothetical protein MNBD_DELTA01-1128 [hydrothermal vent metagenome]|uniref:Uncharacterized protein n=1 Tax=hydrothermal vent metagenome TaxID=652676 RepID=A0A3B0QSZ5_9ZZZZ
MNNFKITFLIILTGVFIFPLLAFSSDFPEKIESKVYEAQGTREELMKKAENCFLLHVVNEEVLLTDASQGAKFLDAAAGEQTKGTSLTIGGGDLFVNISAEEGRIIANNTLDFRSTLVNYQTKTRMTFIAKDGRFKIHHTHIKYAQKSTGYTANTGYRVPKKNGYPKEKVFVKVLGKVTEKVAKCVQKGPEEEW